MNDRWRFQTKEEGGNYSLVAEPDPVLMTDYIGRATRELVRKVHFAEEELILKSTPEPTLERLKVIIDRELERRKYARDATTAKG